MTLNLGKGTPMALKMYTVSQEYPDYECQDTPGTQCISKVVDGSGSKGECMDDFSEKNRSNKLNKTY